jgi:hypothetical protein
MIFSVTDIPTQVPNHLYEIVEHIGNIETTSQGLSRAQVDSLTSKTDESVASTHAFLDRVIQYDVKWRTSVFLGETEYDEAIENSIREALKSWADMTDSLLVRVGDLKALGFFPASLETLPPRVAEVRSMLTPDDEFFEGDELDDLTGRAFREDEQGLTVEFRVMGE